MKRVSQQGTKLSATDLRRIEFQRRIKDSLASPIRDQVEETIVLLDKRKEEGAKPERQWFLDYQATGTPSICEYMGY